MTRPTTGLPPSSGRTTGRVASVLLLLLSVCMRAGASDPSAEQAISINFTVTDDHNLPVPQAVVDARSRGRLVANARTDASGKITISVNGAATYDVTVSKPGYVNASTTLKLSAHMGGQDVEIVLTPANLSQQNITVEGAASNPVTEPAASPATLKPAEAKNAPSKPATLVDALPLIPGVVRAKDGSVSIAGYAENHSTLLVNSVDVTDPATGGFGLSVPIDSVETISVAEMPYLAQYGKFTAGVVAAETRRGGEKWNFSLNDPLPEFRIRSGHLAGLRSATPRLNVSGPVIADRLYFLEGFEYAINKNALRTLPFPENQTTSKAVNSFSQADLIISPKQTLTASFHYAPHSLDFVGLDFFNPQPVTPYANFRETTGTLLHRLAIGEGVLQSTLATRAVSSGIWPHGTGDMVLTPTGNLGSYFSQETRDATRFQWIENWMPRTLHYKGDHTLQLGLVMGRTENEGQFQARPVLMQDAAGHLLQRLDFTGNGTFAVADLESAVYAQDHWMVNPHLAFDAGLRVERQTITQATRTAPRLGFVWALPLDTKTIIRGGMGVFYDTVPLDVYAFDAYPQQTITTYNALGAIIAGPTQFINLTQQAAQRGFAFVDRAATSGNFAPYSLAWNVDVERPITRFLELRVKYLQSRANELLTIEPARIQNQDAFVLSSSGSARTRQLEFTSRIGPTSKRQLFFSYVRQHARGDINDASTYVGNFPFPVIRRNLIASLPTEIPNRFLLWGTYSLPWQLMVIPHLELRNGFAYQPTDVLQQYIATTSGPQGRFPRYFSADLRISKDILINPKHAIRFSGTIRNLTNHFNPLEVHSNIADPQFGIFFGNYVRRFTLDFDFLY